VRAFSRSAHFDLPSPRNSKSQRLIQTAILPAPRHWPKSEFPEVKVVSRDAEVFDDVCNDAARYIAWMPRERDESFRAKGIQVVSVAARGPQELATDLAEAAFQLPAIVRGIFAHESGSQDKFIAEGRRNGASGFEQGFQMRLGRLLKTKRGFAAVPSMRVASGQETGFGNPNAIFVLTHLHFREWNDHNAAKVIRSEIHVKRFTGCHHLTSAQSRNAWRLQTATRCTPINSVLAQTSRSTSRQSAMASRMRAMSLSSDRACVRQPGNSGTLAT